MHISDAAMTTLKASKAGCLAYSFMYVCMYVCVYVCVCMSMHACVCAYVCIHAGMFACGHMRLIHTHT